MLLDRLAPTLISNYRRHTHPSGFSKLLFEEACGTKRDGGRLLPRFMSPRECARLMGFPDS
jgi:site-specific DNA-cytosine methylase